MPAFAEVLALFLCGRLAPERDTALEVAKPGEVPLPIATSLPVMMYAVLAKGRLHGQKLVRNLAPSRGAVFRHFKPQWCSTAPRAFLPHFLGSHYVGPVTSR